MRNSILITILALFFSLNITGCSLFSSDEDEQETATVAEEEMGAGVEDEFASDDFESGGEFGDELGDGETAAIDDDGFGSGGDDLEGDDDFGDDLEFDAEGMANGDGEAGLDDLAGSDVEVEDNFGDDYFDDDYAQVGEAGKAAVDDFSEDFIDDNSFGTGEPETFDSKPVDDSLFVDEGGLPTDTLSSNQDSDLFGQSQEMEPVVDTPSYGDSGYSSFGEEPEKNYVPVKKMKPAAYTRAGGNVNRLYVVRPGDNMDSIAQKIYGDSSRSDDLYSYNSHFRGKTVKVGDKIYYESPSSPNDQMMKTYYEDNGLTPQYYTSDDGDNLRKVSQSLLGHERSWMEIWATNESVESKWRMPAGVRLRYWPDGVSAPPTLAMNEPEPKNDPPPAMDPPPSMPEPEPEPIEELPSNDIAMNDSDMNDDMGLDEADKMAELDEPDFPDEPDEEFNPPPAVGSTGGTPPPPKVVAPPPPPPAPKADFNNKPFPPKKSVSAPPEEDPLAAFSDDSTIMAGIGALLILAAVIVLIFIRRNRAKRVNFSQTQV